MVFFFLTSQERIRGCLVCAFREWFPAIRMPFYYITTFGRKSQGIDMVIAWFPGILITSFMAIALAKKNADFLNSRLTGISFFRWALLSIFLICSLLRGFIFFFWRDSLLRLWFISLPFSSLLWFSFSSDFISLLLTLLFRLFLLG